MKDQASPTDDRRPDEHRPASASERRRTLARQPNARAGSEAKRSGPAPGILDRPVVLVADSDRGRVDWLRSFLDAEIVTAAGQADAVREVASRTSPPRRIDAVIVGPELIDGSPAHLTAEIAESDDSPPVFTLSDDGESGPGPGGDGDGDGDAGGKDESGAIAGVFYQLDRRMSGDQIAQLIASALTDKGHGDDELDSPEEATRLSRILDTVRHFATQTELSQAADHLERAVARITDADRASCLFHDPSDGSLWSVTDETRHDTAGLGPRGLAGFSARTAAGLAVERACDDPRYDRATDDPIGKGDESIITAPVRAPDGTVHAVLIAVRASRPFSERRRHSLELLSEHLGPLMHQMALRVEADSVLEETRSAQPAYDLFRTEALEAYLSRGKQGDVVRVSPDWVRWIYWPLLVLLLVSAVILIVGRVDQYSTGAAVVRTSGRGEVTANVSGTVISVEVSPGQRVERDQVLARLHDAGEVDDLARLEDELHTQLRNRMLDPSDAAASQAVRTLRSQVQNARAQLERRIIRAPRSGSVSDVRIRAGQHLRAGDLVVSLVNDDSALSVIALLPGGDRPQFKPGMLIRLELAGYRYAYQYARIRSVGDEIIGPAEARRYLGGRISDGIALAGPVVVVEATLPGSTFVADDITYEYHDGMQGIAEVRVRSKRVIVALIPQLEKL